MIPPAQACAFFFVEILDPLMDYVKLWLDSATKFCKIGQV